MSNRDQRGDLPPDTSCYVCKRSFALSELVRVAGKRYCVTDTPGGAMNVWSQPI